MLGTRPDIAFAVGDTRYYISSRDFGFGPAGEGYTLGGIQSRGDLSFDIFGDVFLKNVYVVCKYLPCAEIESKLRDISS